MKHFNAFARCLTLLLAALMLSGMLALAEPAVDPGRQDETETVSGVQPVHDAKAAQDSGAEETAGPEEAHLSYDVIYSSANPIPEIAERVRPAIVQLNTLQESWDLRPAWPR